MPFPKTTKVHARGDLNVAVDELREQKNYIAEEVMPPFLVKDQAATFPVIPKEVMLETPDTRRAMRGNYSRSDWEFEMGFYATSEKGREEVLDDRERKLYADLIDAEMVVTARAAEIMLRTQEIRVAAKLFNTSNFTVHNLSTEWSSLSTADPLGDINDAVAAVRTQCGMLPNCLILPWQVFRNVRANEKIQGLLKYTYPGKDLNSISAADLAQILNIPRILIADAQKNTAARGKSAVLGDIWSSEYAMLTRVATSNDFSDPCIGRIFRWNEEASGDSGGIVVEQYREESSRGDVYRVRNDADEALMRSLDDDKNILSNIAADVSYLIGNCTA